MTIYTVYNNIDQKDLSQVSRHYTLKGAAKSYYRAHTGNLRRIIDDQNCDVTAKAKEQYG